MQKHLISLKIGALLLLVLAITSCSSTLNVQQNGSTLTLSDTTPSPTPLLPAPIPPGETPTTLLSPTPTQPSATAVSDAVDPTATANPMPKPTATPLPPGTPPIVPPAPPSSTPVTTAANPLLFHDEFDATSLDTSVWNTCYRWACDGGWNQELERYVPQQVTLSGGTLHLTADKGNVTAHGINYNYVSGMVTTADHFSFQYGYMETRFQIPAGQGLWPAAWLLSQQGAPIVELDVMENLGNDPNTVHMTVHYPDPSTQKHKHIGKAFTGSNFSAGFHTFGVDWQVDHITWYIDGVAQFTVTDQTQIPHTPLYILLNLAVGGSWPGSPNASTLFPSTFLVDYVRVWQHRP